jgi:polyisoprenoid-binding protein YceI
MKYFILALVILFLCLNLVPAQSFKVKSSGIQTFNFEDKSGRNQATFTSQAPLEDINGTASGISGTVSFDPANFAKTLKGKILVQVASINTGIELRNHHLQSANWLDAKNYPSVSFEIVSVYDLKQVADNKLEFKIKGNFSAHGITKEVTADAESSYLIESEATQKRAPGDLLGVHAKFNIKLSEFNVDNALIGNKVSENIEIGVNLVGSNKM